MVACCLLWLLKWGFAGWGEGDGTGLYSWRRSVVEEIAPGPSDITVKNTSFVLAAERTHRSDPLDGNKRYSGGWNISNQHYWAVSFPRFPKSVSGCVWMCANFLWLDCCGILFFCPFCSAFG